MVKELTGTQVGQPNDMQQIMNDRRFAGGTVKTLFSRKVEPTTANFHAVDLTGDTLVIHADFPAAVAIALYTNDNRLICKKAMSAPLFISPYEGTASYKIRIANESRQLTVNYTLMSLTRYLESLCDDIINSEPCTGSRN